MKLWVKFLIVAVGIPLLIALFSWQSQAYAEYCEEIDKCAKYNLFIYGWLVVTHFTHVFESFFVILLTLAIALFGRQTDLAEKQHGLQREE